MDFSFLIDIWFRDADPNVSQAWLMAAAAGLKLGADIYRSITAGKELKKLRQQQFPEFAETEAHKTARMRANEMAERGFTAEETAAATQARIRSQNTGRKMALDRAPGLSQAVMAGLNYTNTAAINQFAAMDAAQKRRNIEYADRFARDLQDLSNRNIQVQIQSRLEAERSLGDAKGSWLKGISDIGASGMNIAGYLEGQKLAGGGDPDDSLGFRNPFKKKETNSSNSDDPIGIHGDRITDLEKQFPWLFKKQKKYKF